MMCCLKRSRFAPPSEIFSKVTADVCRRMVLEFVEVPALGFGGIAAI